MADFVFLHLMQIFRDPCRVFVRSLVVIRLWTLIRHSNEKQANDVSSIRGRANRMKTASWKQEICASPM